MLYVARTRLGYSEEEFWRLTLRKLCSQLDILDGKKPENKHYIDEIIGF